MNGRLLLVLVGAVGLVPSGAFAQCTTSRSNNVVPPSRISAGVTFIGGGNSPMGCTVAGMNSTSGNLLCTVVLTAPGMYNCPGTVATGCVGLLGVVSPTTNPMGPHTCSFNCPGCGSFTVTNADGLPVELMDFDVEVSSGRVGPRAQDPG